MNYYIFIRPLIGAFTGYVTNWIAVKMMFRPLNPIKIGNFTVPFTPGLIPKNKPRLAETIGNIISKDLLSEDTLKENLLSDTIKNKLSDNLYNYLNNYSTVEELICSFTGDEIYENKITHIKNKISNSIYNTIVEANLGNLISEQIKTSANEKMKNPILGFLGGNAIMSSIMSNISSKIDEYILNNGQDLIYEMVNKEINKYTSKKINDISTNINNAFISIYENIILEKLPQILNTINISKMVTDKINSMDVLELEKLILVIMKKELNALVNLGALIGFILGLLNLLF